MFVTWVECDVERKMMLMKENKDWVRSELKTLTSSIQSWYARNSVRISIKRHERLSELHHIFQIVQAYTLACWSSSIFWMISIVCNQSSSLNKAYECLYFAEALCFSFESLQLYNEHYNTLLAALLLTFIVSLNVLWYFIIILLTS